MVKDKAYLYNFKNTNYKPKLNTKLTMKYVTLLRRDNKLDRFLRIVVRFQH